MLDADAGLLVESAGAADGAPAATPVGSGLSIKRAADIDGMFEVVGYGRVSEPSGAAQEMEIELFGRRIDARGRVRGSGELERFSIGCGHFDDFTIGSRWLGGELQTSRHSEKIYTAEIGRSWIEHIGECRDDADAGRPAPCFSYSGIREAPCLVLPLENCDARISFAAVPVLELARLIFGVSSRFALQVFDGLRDPSLVPDRVLFDRKESRRTGPSSILLMCNREFTDDEALLAAMLIADPGLRAFHDGLFQSYMVGRPTEGPHAAYLRAPAQFPPGTRISFAGRWVDIGSEGRDQRRFLITRLLSIAIPASFQRVEMVYSSTTVNRDLPPRDVPRNRRPQRPVEVETGVPPAVGNDVEELTTHGGSVIIGAGVEVVRKPRVEGDRAPRRMSGYKDREGPGSGSTSDRLPGGDADVSPVSMFREQGDSDEPADETSPPVARQPLEATFAALEHMCVRNKWRLLPLGSGPFSLRRIWDARRCMTSVLVVVVATSARNVLVIDPGTYAGDERSLGLLVPAHGRAGIDPAEVDRILRQWAHFGGRWGGHQLQARLRRHYVIRPIARRTRAHLGARLYGEQLQEAVLSLIP